VNCLLLTSRRARFAAGHRFGLVLAGALFTQIASASVFLDYVTWPKGNDGFTTINVCIVDGSTAQEKGDGAFAGFIHDANPSLADVISRIRIALANTWEANSGVRFKGWKTCSQLSQAEQYQALGVYISPDAANESGVGVYMTRGQVTVAAHGVSIKPWGNDFNRCIYYNGFTTHMSYKYDCAEQYAIHEFGHAIGFMHEWRHPLKPASCTAKDDTIFGDPRTGNPNVYDWNSIMTYWDGCVHQNGVRFGTTTLSDWDIAGVKRLYPAPTQDCAATGSKVKYQAHVGNIGWMTPVCDDAVAGTTGQSLMMQAIRIQLTGAGGTGCHVLYQAHVQNMGWMGIASDGQTAGTTGQSLRMEALKAILQGCDPRYHIYYQAHVQGIGWMPEVTAGEIAGTTGQGLRMEAVKIRIGD